MGLVRQDLELGQAMTTLYVFPPLWRDGTPGINNIEQLVHGTPPLFQRPFQLSGGLSYKNYKTFKKKQIIYNVVVIVSCGNLFVQINVTKKIFKYYNLPVEIDMLEHAEHDSSEIYDRPLGYGIFESELYLFSMHWSR